MADVLLNNKTLDTSSATTAPAALTQETWTTTALAAGIPALANGDTYALVDCTPGATGAQQAEIVRCTVTTGTGATSITVIRGCDGTTPVAHASSSTWAIVLTRGGVPPVMIPQYGLKVGDYNLKNAYDPVRGLYNWKDSNTRIGDQGLGDAMLPSDPNPAAGLSRGGGQTSWVIYGDSISSGAVSGVGATVIDRLRSWPLACRDQLANAGIPTAGTGIVRARDVTLLDARLISATGTWTSQTCYSTATLNGSTATFRMDKSGTYIDVLCYDGTGTVFTVAVDGTVARTITLSGSTGWKIFKVPNVNVIGNFSKILLTVTTLGSPGFIFGGLGTFTPNGGLQVHNFAQGGSKVSGTGASSWGDSTNLGLVFKDAAGRARAITDAASTVGSPFLDSPAQAAFTDEDLGKSWDQTALDSGGLMFPPGSYIGARTSGTRVTMYTGTGSNAQPVNALATLSGKSGKIGRDPSWFMFCIGGNDMTAGATDSDITTGITNVRNQFPNSNFLLILTSEWNTTLVSAARMKTYQEAMYALADTLDCPLFDLRGRVGTFAQAAAVGSAGDNQAHITSGTQASIGASLASIMGSGSGRTGTPLEPVAEQDVVPVGYMRRRRAKVGALSMVSNTTEQVVCRIPLPANLNKVGDVIKVLASSKPASSSTTTWRIRIGTTGTISDAAVVVLSATAASANQGWHEGMVGVQAIGASATILGTGSSTVGAASTTGTQTATSGTYSTLVDNWISLTIQSGTANVQLIHAALLELVTD